MIRKTIYSLLLTVIFICPAFTYSQNHFIPTKEYTGKQKTQSDTPEKPSENRLVIAGVGGGLGYLGGRSIKNLHRDDREFLRKLKTGMILKADLSFSTQYNFRLGARYNYFNSTAGFSSILTDEYNNDIYSHLETNVSTSFVSAFIETRIKVSNYSVFVFDFGLGFMFSKESNFLRSDILGQEVVKRGNALGISAGGSYEFWPTDYWALVLRADLLTGIPWEFNDSYINHIFNQSVINLSRAEIGVGIRFVL